MEGEVKKMTAISVIILIIPLIICACKYSYGRGWKEGYDEGWIEAGGLEIPHEDLNY